MNKFTGILWGCLLALAGFAAQAAPYTTATYYGLDATDSPVVAMNQAGTVIWRKTYAPYGKASNKDQDNRIGYTGHVENANGLVDAGARHYDPALGVFTSDDPVRFDENNPASFNRYAYANNNPYKFVDPDGKVPVPLVLMGIAKAADVLMTAAEVYTAAETGGASAAAVVAAESAATSVVPGGKVLSKIANSAKPLYRSMSRAEADAVLETGKLRGGWEGETYFTDSRFGSADKAQDRLSLPSRPEVQMEFRIKNNPSMVRDGARVDPANGGGGGGREYMTTDPVEVEVINVQSYR